MDNHNYKNQQNFQRQSQMNNSIFLNQEDFETNENDNNRSKKRVFRKKNRIILIIISIIIIALLILFVAFGANILNKLSRGRKECLSKICIQHSNYVRNTMDLNVNPCNDFYEFSCGGWKNTFEIPRYRARFITFDSLTAKNYEAIKGMII